MLKVALTGGMACGKSVVSEMFARRGARVAQADKIAHELMRPGEAVYADIVRTFGHEILAPDGTIDRMKLAQAAFATHPPRIEELNRIVHPAVIRRQDQWMEEVVRDDPGAVVIVEAALIFEARVERRFDRVVVVTCGDEQKVERLARRMNASKEIARNELARRAAAQLPDAEKARRADYVIENSGPLEQTEREVARVYEKLKRESERRAALA